MKEACDHFNELLHQKKYKKLIEHVSVYLLIYNGPSFIYSYRAYAKSQMRDLVGAGEDYSKACSLFKSEAGCFDFHKNLTHVDDKIIQLWKSWYQTYLNVKKIQQMKSLYKTPHVTLFSKQTFSPQVLETISESTESEEEMSHSSEFN